MGQNSKAKHGWLIDTCNGAKNLEAKIATYVLAGTIADARFTCADDQMALVYKAFGAANVDAIVASTTAALQAARDEGAAAQRKLRSTSAKSTEAIRIDKYLGRARWAGWCAIKDWHASNKTDDMPDSIIDLIGSRVHPPGTVHAGKPVGTCGGALNGVQYRGQNVNLQIRFEANQESRAKKS